jgi:hypothetical protein
LPKVKPAQCDDGSKQVFMYAYGFSILCPVGTFHHPHRRWSSPSSYIPLPLPSYTLITSAPLSPKAPCRRHNSPSCSILFAAFTCNLVFRRLPIQERLAYMAGTPTLQVSHLVLAALDKCGCFPRRERLACMTDKDRQIVV